MNMKNNAFFEQMKQTAVRYEAARVERLERKRKIIKEKGFGSPELAAWYQEDNAARFPFTSGAWSAYRAWESSVYRQESELDMDMPLSLGEFPDFLETLRKAGLHSFVYTCRSTATMDNIHDFAAHGCTMEGLCTITRRETRWGEEEPDEVCGIRFLLN
jgi:hypothetical protein